MPPAGDRACRRARLSPGRIARTNMQPPPDAHPHAPAGTQHDSITRLLASAEAGQADAWHRIYDLLYDDLHRIARSQIRRQAGSVLSPTSLVSETWLKLAGAELDVGNRHHLTMLIARAMRFVLLDEARRVLADKRQAGAGTVVLDEEIAQPGARDRLEQLLALDQALDGLACLDERLARVVELRYFGGLTEEEVAGMLSLNVRTIRRDWRRARAYLLDRLGEGARDIAI